MVVPVSSTTLAAHAGCGRGGAGRRLDEHVAAGVPAEAAAAVAAAREGAPKAAPAGDQTPGNKRFIYYSHSICDYETLAIVEPLF